MTSLAPGLETFLGGQDKNMKLLPSGLFWGAAFSITCNVTLLVGDAEIEDGP